ncbi:pyridoxamine 5'-phosphate oxidase family protein [Oceanicella sp. SM1341]|uniref:pyridoxamine 5'-phosphate oxidase family protein n=1 Tax=Oceanicella sp. SM1341 TaxID=1548889 RepID=UPI000E529C28|nr:pyridoxamine 5'-phosphate oxidase family protein [Oceanicella sp. SM1341]
MHPLPDDVLDELGRAVLCWLATTDASGQPSVSPKEIFAPGPAGDILIADIASAGSVRAIRAQPKVCVSFIDIFRQRGFKCIGTAEVLGPEAEGFDALAAPLIARAGPGFPVRHVIRVAVARHAPILAPSYRLFPERSEAERVRAAQASYGVRPAD